MSDPDPKGVSLREAQTAVQGGASAHTMRNGSRRAKKPPAGLRPMTPIMSREQPVIPLGYLASPLLIGDNYFCRQE